ncbi:MAG: hypothetical protein AAF436_06600 [Myxococcota bacterium]
MTEAHSASEQDKSFIEALEAFELAPGDFDHRAHLRMAYAYLCEHDATTTCCKIREALRGLLAHAGIEPSTKYHETMTQAWVLAVRHFMACTPTTKSAAEFLEANPELLDTRIMSTHYSREALFSNVARRSFVPPDRASIPT